MNKPVVYLLLSMVVLCSVYTALGDEIFDGISGNSSQVESQGVSESSQNNKADSGTISSEGRHAFANQRSGSMGNAPMFRSNRLFVPANVPAYNKEKQMAYNPRVVVKDEVLDRSELSDFLKQNTHVVRGISHFQEYVTPYEDAILSYLEEEGLDDKYEIYEKAVSWVWVSDMTLTGRQESWLTPSEFLYDSPEYTSNPLEGSIVSDCEDQANALASLLIASGEYDESSVRVAIGEVSFGDVVGGHAWVEVYEEGRWFPLDATVGPYYDDNKSELVDSDSSETGYYYFRDEGYSVLEIWYYYNNEYFIDIGNRIGNAPDNWMSISSGYY
ncbi:transglutaminase domain-containing protein [Methanolobus sp. ZRKC2]|uniref:transglutaminase domain-containing protein n=1 Tax=Methanolobus sp. ZRKC2 TaxID=3125783 RepID=UPI00324B75FE